jgi:hypothetical protein
MTGFYIVSYGSNAFCKRFLHLQANTPLTGEKRERSGQEMVGPCE